MPEPSLVVDDYISESPPVGLDISIESLSTRIEPIGTSTATSGQPSVVKQISPNGTIFAGDSSDGIPQSTSEVIVISDDEDIEEIKIVDLTSKDNKDPEMDIEIVDLTSASN
ncbi:hypothetical protein AHAS_Ahas01G0116900 [Arachis hypogaea]